MRRVLHTNMASPPRIVTDIREWRRISRWPWQTSPENESADYDITRRGILICRESCHGFQGGIAYCQRLLKQFDRAASLSPSTPGRARSGPITKEVLYRERFRNRTIQFEASFTEAPR